MASVLIHLAIAKELEDKLDIEDKKDYYLGSIAPDIAKQIGMRKADSHFSFNTRKDNPNLDLFVRRYPTFKYNSFNLGYFIHLYTDKVWENEIINKLTGSETIKLLDGTIINVPSDEVLRLIYSDYTNLNIQIINEYNLDLSLFYEEFKVPNTPLTEIPVDKLDILINKMGIIIENSTEDKQYIFDLYIIKEFINDIVKRVLEELKKY